MFVGGEYDDDGDDDGDDDADGDDDGGDGGYADKDFINFSTINKIIVESGTWSKASVKGTKPNDQYFTLVQIRFFSYGKMHNDKNDSVDW